MFLEDTGLKTFKIQACYDILKDEPKFKELQDSKNLIKRKRKANISAIEEDAPVALPSDDDTQPSTSNTIRTARPVGQKKAKMLQQNKDTTSEASWDKVLQEIKRKNEILERQSNEIRRASDIKIITTPIEGLDEMSKSLLLQLKAELVVKFNSNRTEDFLDDRASSSNCVDFESGCIGEPEPEKDTDVPV
ncbi:uncharacterized protein LOC129718719 [Wyeomyia smithii]|uniref:uncharacterized protein LOC129718719 n=1 Tax=Wyeomyia smithii TaxID=174621 RepID=UPI002467B337|nr:uncharacterized protein LOC129718719 [Wyeomyia smithii]